MDGNTIIQVTTIICAAIVSIVTLIVRAHVKSLEAQITVLNATFAQLQNLIVRQTKMMDDMHQENKPSRDV